MKSLAVLVARKRKAETPDCITIDWTSFKHVQGPYVLLARLIVLAAVPFPGSRGSPILAFLNNFAPNINKHIPVLWQQRIPLLQHYHENHSGTSGVTPSWDQGQWEDWLLALLDDTVAEVDLEQWTNALAGSLAHQLALYQSEKEVKEKCFLMKSLGQVLKRMSAR